jgi:hypothetical protein
MTNNSVAGSGSSKYRQAVANPYLKKKVQITAPALSKLHANNAGQLNTAPKAPITSAAGNEKAVPNATGAKSKFANNAVTPNKMQTQRAHNNMKPHNDVSAVKAKPTSSHVKPNVTPTPKKLAKQVPPAPKLPNALLSIKQIPTAKPAPTKPLHTSTKPTAKSALIKSKPSTLKSQLKYQIASLKHAKKQRILQKEHERQLALKEAQQKQKQEEMMILLKQKEEERRSKEKERQLQEAARREKIIRKEVGSCVSQLVKRVEVRVGWEQSRGVPYQIGECLQFLVTEVEKRIKPQLIGGYSAGMMPFSVYPVQMLHRQVITPMHPMHMVPYQAASAPVSVKPKVTQPKPLILHPNPMEKYSPFGDSYKVLEDKICMVKKAGESFGVTLRFESRSVLVPRDDEVNGSVVKSEVGGANLTVKAESVQSTTSPASVPSVDVAGAASTSNPASALNLLKNGATPLSTAANSVPNTSHAASNQKPKKKRRRRVNYGVMVVTDASANFIPAPGGKHSQGLKYGDLILEINGRNVGGLTFTEACKAISTITVEDKTGIISCSLKVARMIQIKAVATPQPISAIPLNSGSMNDSALVSRHVAMPSTSAMSLPHTPPIPFIVIGDKVSGEFTASEWQTLVQSLTLIRRELSTGLALQPVSQKAVLVECLKRNEVRTILQQRSLETIEMKLSYEEKKINSEMKRLAENHWTLAWKSEVENDADNEHNALFQDPLTDAKRSLLRSLARPTTGCRCGSTTHEFVNDPKCVLYRDVNADDTTNHDTVDNIKEATKKSKARNAMEAAYIQRFVQLRAETEAAKLEAEFILNMEMKQSSEMGKAVFAPKLLCTMVLSAIASLTDEMPNDDHHMIDSSAVDKNVGSGQVREEVAVAESSDEDSDDEDVPQTALAQVGSKREQVNVASASPKRLKLNSETQTKNNPSPYFLAKLLKYISKTYGHLYQEPTHLEYAW